MVHTKCKEINCTGHDGSGGTDTNTEKSGWTPMGGLKEAGRPRTNKERKDNRRKQRKHKKKDPYTRVSLDEKLRTHYS